MVRTAINLYSVRDLDEPMLDILDRVADAGYDGVQFSGGLRDATPGEVRAKLDETGLDVTGAHVGIELMEADLPGEVETYGGLGADSLVVPSLGGEHYESSETVTAAAGRLVDLADELAEHDMGLHYHNHAHEFVEIAGSNGLELLAERSGVGLEVDVGWAATGGADPAALIRHFGDQVDLVHMKDMALGTDEDRAFREIGEGDVDMQACADAARAVDASWLIYEHDQPADPAASIDTGAAFLRRL